ncbi:FadR family transcriptional regulator [Geomonas sp. Red32]|uniref:FadR/GntR family transcriptional regulator n=1 Tax=Geomonas sp. Red32 TaxID=2912856 RepID=UPI00202CEC53|nr:FadR/GntR family transcriptional regulator [Geomonas sp. Red32]MCM0082649.1 FadR family transcriptional regulator [Geomonas sp. Red32]
MMFTPIKPKKVSTQIAEQIRASILAGEFTPGEKLPPERELAEMFGVSRPSVREALNLLASSGMVETYQGGGTIVRSLVEVSTNVPLSELIRIDGDRALDVIEVRKGMESWTSYYAASRALPEDLRRLELVIEGMSKNLEDLKHSEDLDAHFHTLIAKATHNVVWFHMMQSIFDAMQEFQRDVWRAVYMSSDDHHLLFSHHRRIYDMIRERNPEGARDAMLEHLTFAHKRCSAYVSSRGGADLPVA